MPKFMKKPIVIEAHRWFKNGDHPKDDQDTFMDSAGNPFLGEGKVVRYYRRPDISGTNICAICKKTMHEHGWIDVLENGHNVCPGDWIIEEEGEYYPCGPDIFAVNYKLVWAGS